MAELVILTINVHGLRDKIKRRAVFDFLENVNFDLCFVQEAHLRDGGGIRTFSGEWTGRESVWGVGGVHSSGSPGGSASRGKS